MANLLGDLWFAGQAPLAWQRIFSAADAHLHLYAKAQPRPGPQDGTFDLHGDTAEQAVAEVKRLRRMHW